MSDTPSFEHALEILDRLTPQLNHFPDTQLAPIRVSAERAWEQAHTLLEAFAHLRPRLPEVFMPAHHAGIERDAEELLDYALAFYASDLQVVRLQQAKSPDLRRLEAEIRRCDNLLSHWARLLFKIDPTEGPIVRKLLAGTGSRDSAEDVLGFSALFLRRWDELTQSPWAPVLREQGITEDTLQQMAADATRWMSLTLSPSTTPTMQHLRHRSYSAFLQRYECLLRVGRYLEPEGHWMPLSAVRSARALPPEFSMDPLSHQS